MKGFPNQVAELATLARAMKVLNDLNVEAQNPKDDGVLGEALVRSGVLGTGHTSIPVEDYLAHQKTKKASDQSFRTRARGLRELFRILGLIDDSGEQIVVTRLGRQIVSIAERELTPESLLLWRNVVLNMMHDGGDGESSHPYQVLLRLVARCPGITRAKCALALEAKNDSEGELDRIVGISDLEEDKILQEIGVTQPNWDNAKKILPRFAEQLGDVQKVSHNFYLSDAPGVQRDAPQDFEKATKEKGPRKPKSSRSVTASSIAESGTDVCDETEDIDEVAIDPAILRASKAKIKARLKRHNLIVKKVAEVLEAEKAELFEDPFDCLACFPNEGLLIEVKSLDGTVKDEVDRVRDALSQLLYYESFVTRPLVKSRAVKKVACFEQKVSDPHVDWLQQNDIQVIWSTESGFDGTDQAKTKLRNHFGFL